MRRFCHRTTVLRATRRLLLEGLESRTILCASECTLVNGMLVLDLAPEVLDAVSITRNESTGSIDVALNQHRFSYDSAAVKGIHVNGAKGTDVVQVDGSLSLPVFQNGVLSAANDAAFVLEADTHGHGDLIANEGGYVSDQSPMTAFAPLSHTLHSTGQAGSMMSDLLPEHEGGSAMDSDNAHEMGDSDLLAVGGGFSHHVGVPPVVSGKCSAESKAGLVSNPSCSCGRMRIRRQDAAPVEQEEAKQTCNCKPPVDKDAPVPPQTEQTGPAPEASDKPSLDGAAESEGSIGTDRTLESSTIDMLFQQILQRNWFESSSRTPDSRTPEKTSSIPEIMVECAEEASIETERGASSRDLVVALAGLTVLSYHPKSRTARQARGLRVGSSDQPTTAI